MYNVVEHEAELRLARAWPDDKGGRGMQQDPEFIQRPQIETCKKTNHIFKILSSMRGLRSMQDPVRCGHRELGAPGLGRGNLSHCVRVGKESGNGFKRRRRRFLGVLIIK